MAIKQSFSWWCFSNRGLDDDSLLATARKIGYDAVELIPPTLFDRAVDFGLAIASHAAHESIERGMNNPAEHARIEREVRLSLELAVKHNIPNLIVFGGSRQAGLPESDGIAAAVDCLTRLAPAAEDAGVTLTLELLNSKVDHPGYECDHTDWGVEVCKRVGSPRVRLLYDIYHMQIMEGDIIATIGASHEYFAHYHTAGVPGRGDMDDIQELNYPAIFAAIAETGYAGFVGHEFIPKGEPAAALEAAYRLLTGV